MKEFSEFICYTKFSSPFPHNYQDLITSEINDVQVPDNFPYRKIVGNLMYAMLCTRPDIATAVLVIRILQYVNNTLSYCLVYRRDGGNEYANEVGYKSKSTLKNIFFAKQKLVFKE